VPGAESTSKEFSPRSATWKRRRVKILRPPIIDTDFHVGYWLKMRYIMIYHDILIPFKKKMTNVNYHALIGKNIMNH